VMLVLLLTLLLLLFVGGVAVTPSAFLVLFDLCVEFDLELEVLCLCLLPLLWVLLLFRRLCLLLPPIRFRRLFLCRRLLLRSDASNEWLDSHTASLLLPLLLLSPLPSSAKKGSEGHAIAPMPSKACGSISSCCCWRQSRSLKSLLPNPPPSASLLLSLLPPLLLLVIVTFACCGMLLRMHVGMYEWCLENE